MDPQTPQDQPTPPAVETPTVEQAPATAPQPIYQAPPQAGGYPPAQAKTNVFAILSLVFAFLFPLLGLVFGIVASSQIKKTGEQGKGLATAGTVLSAIFVVLGILWFVFVVLVAVSHPGTTTRTYNY